MSIIRWRFLDTETSEEAILQINPKEMTTPTSARESQFAQGTRYGSHKTRGFLKPAGSPAAWSFGGVILSKTHFDMLEDWQGRDVILRVTDHLERTFEIIIESWDVIERLPTMTRAWRADFTMNCLLLREI